LNVPLPTRLRQRRGAGRGAGDDGGRQSDPAFSRVVSPIGLAGAFRRDLEVAVADFLSHLSSVNGEPLDGVLGHNFLKEFRVTIDYTNGKIRLEPGMGWALRLPGGGGVW
jgi:hypothetical protein